MSGNATPVPAIPEQPPASESNPEPAKKSNHVLETPADSPDPDEAELADALKAVEAEGNGATPAPEPSLSLDTPPAPPPAPIVEPAAPQMVPVSAVQDERTKRQAAETEARNMAARALYYQGVAAGKYPVPNVDPATPPPSPVDDRTQAIRTAQAELADQVDKGTLSVKEYESKRSLLDDELYEIRETRTLEKVNASKGGDLYLDAVTGHLASENPWIDQVPTEELLDLQPGAIRDLERAGVNFKAIAGTPMGDYRLREAVIGRAKRRGLDREYGQQPPAQPGAAPATPAVPPNTIPTEADRKAKEALALGAPPTPSGTNAPVNAWTEERVEGMDSVDLENMPMADLKRLGSMMDQQATARRVNTPTRR